MIINSNNNPIKDSKLNSIFTDTNGDGVQDKYVDIDTDSSGIVDNRIDVNGDGTKESAALDTDLDGIIDSFLALDLNNDGIEDYTVTDKNNDGFMDSFSQKINVFTENITTDTDSIVKQTQDLLKKINDLTASTNDIGQRTALQTAQSAYIDALIEAEASRKTLQMNNQASQQNAMLDQQMMALRHNYNVLTKQTEQYVLDAQVREQLTNLFFSLEKTMMDNSFSLAKQVVQSAKY